MHCASSVHRPNQFGRHGTGALAIAAFHPLAAEIRARAPTGRSAVRPVNGLPFKTIENKPRARRRCGRLQLTACASGSPGHRGFSVSHSGKERLPGPCRHSWHARVLLACLEMWWPLVRIRAIPFDDQGRVPRRTRARGNRSFPAKAQVATCTSAWIRAPPTYPPSNSQ